ncbi:peptide-methionine (S)-S-oxide reductase MsrA [Methanoplanus endosymbiosus]|uniref:Peptide methionine sulfoxide reductase MsrA n=1 Tax=Methanoplanus endosymbiosus TaxID=33865 RepID=A0A9E7TGG9_9EURY|nr:peptide-methionine (S)-S-oxide reductase MsrA [Methanoplanus endosymbiosus]UUX91122.1 peptide-methionine (S)-S-oxide reductase MsrA [Methanoplanus endosymbiosus]
MVKDNATFAAGCFWGVEAAFQRKEGILVTRVGYTGGETKDPDYTMVCTGNTGHAEAVQIAFDNDIISYRELLEIFFSVHDPTTLNRQGPDVGDQYRSAIFYRNDEQKKEALNYIKELEEKKAFESPVVTEVLPLGDFWKAEDYHQKYFEKMGRKYGFYD